MMRWPVRAVPRGRIVESSADIPGERRVTLTMALIPDRICTFVWTIMCFCMYKRKARLSVESELDELLEFVEKVKMKEEEGREEETT